MFKTNLVPSKLKREIVSELEDLFEESLAWNSMLEEDSRTSVHISSEQVPPRILVLGAGDQSIVQGAAINGTMQPTNAIFLHPHGSCMPEIKDRKGDTEKVGRGKPVRVPSLTQPTSLLQRLRMDAEGSGQRQLEDLNPSVSRTRDSRSNHRRRSKTATPTSQATFSPQKRQRAHTYDERTLTREPALAPLNDVSLPSPPYPDFGAQGLAWTYFTGTGVDNLLMNAGIWLWYKPQTYRQRTIPGKEKHSSDDFPSGIDQPLHSKGTLESKFMITEPSRRAASRTVNEPFMVMTNISEPRITPLITRYPGRLQIVKPHFPPWPDARADPLHPDFLSQSKLASYQACEIVGHKIWRRDRDAHLCSRQGCRNPAPDFSPNTRVCIGCGPNSITRYCSHDHELEAFSDHWKTCGSPHLVSQAIVDHSTSPLHFDSMCPAISRTKGKNSYEIHRQRHYACHSCGHYTLFMPEQASNLTLTWPQVDPSSREMNFRIERLLNIAFLKADEIDVLEYLYCLLRHLIFISPLNSEKHLQALKTQFGAEFGNAIYQSTDLDAIYPCECVWYGRSPQIYTHLKTCRLKNLRYERGDLGLLENVTQLERRHWILRAWSQQHPHVTDWKLRAQGVGYGLTENNVQLGPGFIGLGARPSNMLRP